MFPFWCCCLDVSSVKFSYSCEVQDLILQSGASPSPRLKGFTYKEVYSNIVVTLCGKDLSFPDVVVLNPVIVSNDYSMMWTSDNNFYYPPYYENQKVLYKGSPYFSVSGCSLKITYSLRGYGSNPINYCILDL